MSMPDLTFSIESAAALRFAAAPHITFKLRVANDSALAIQTIILRCQVQLDVSRRAYNHHEQVRLRDLFGPAAQWGETLRSLLWTNTSVVVPSFEKDIAVELQVPCTFDFNVAATKYFAGVEDGAVPVGFYFNGTIFYAGDDGVLQATHISWDKEASYRLPVHVWQELMDAYYPNAAWLCLSREVFNRLYDYKVRHGIPTLDDALADVLDKRTEARPA